MFVATWIGELLQVMEGRRSQIILLDDRKLEIIIQPKLYAGDLLAIVSSHFNLKEKEYFGLAYLDNDGHYNWLHLDHHVLDHEFPKKSNESFLTLHFLVKYYIESISHLKDSVTFEQFYLQTKSLIFKGQIEVEHDVAFKLASYALQVTHGDYTNDSSAVTNLKKLSILPSYITNDNSLQWEEKVVVYYKGLVSQHRGSCIVKFMTIVEKLPTYGVHFYDVKDKNGARIWLGLSHKGIAVYDHCNKKIPKKVYQWKQLENLYFRDRKFSIEVHDSKRVIHALSSFNLYEEAIEEPRDCEDQLSDAICDPTTQVSVSRRTFGPGNVVVVVWYAANSTLTKSIWSMAISQHQFHLDKKQSKVSLPCESKLNDIAAELSVSKGSLSTNSSSVSRCESSQSLNSSQPSQWNGGPSPEEMAELSELEKAARKEMLMALKSKKDILEQKLKEKTEELKLLCLKEGGIIGELPPDTPLSPGEPRPQVRRRMGTSFTFPENLINKLKSNEGEELADLELEFEIQSKIVSAALKLANDTSAKRGVRKQRIICYKQSQAKLKSLEFKLAAAKSLHNQKTSARGQIKKKQPRPSVTSTDEVDFLSMVDGISLSPVTTPVTPSTPSSSKSSKISDAHDESNVNPTSGIHLFSELPQSLGSSCTSISRSSPSTPTSDSRLIIQSCSRNTSPSRLSSGGYIPNSVYQTKSSYRNQHYPTFSTKSKSQFDFDKLSNRSSSVSGKFSPAFHNKCDGALLIETRGLYNVPMQRTSQAFYSQDELDELREIQNSHGSDSSRSSGRRSRYQPSSQNCCGSLDRAFSGSAAYNGRMESRSLDNLDYSEGDQAVFEPEPEFKGIVEEPDDVFKPVFTDQNTNVQNIAFRNETPIPILRYDTSPARRQEMSGVKVSQQKYEPSPQIIRHKVPGMGMRWQSNDYHIMSDSTSRSSLLSVDQSLLRTVDSCHQPPNLSPALCASLLSITPDLSPKAKEKEWYETCVDSPLPPRKQSLSFSDSSPKSPVTTVSNTSVLSSPVKPQISNNHTYELYSPYENGETISPTLTGVSEQDGGGSNGSVYLPVPFQSPRNCTVVSVGQFQPYREETKPYETSDYLKYSTKYRKQLQLQSPTDTKSVNKNSVNCVVESELDVSSMRLSRVNLTVDTQDTNKLCFQMPNAHLGQTSSKSSPRDDLNRVQYRNPSFQYLPQMSSDCIGPDEAYNPRFEMSFLPSPGQLQGIYDPPKAMTCEPLCRSDSVNMSHPSPTAIRSNSLIKSRDNSFTIDKSASLSDAFHEEMLAWYEDQDTRNQATLV